MKTVTTSKVQYEKNRRMGERLLKAKPHLKKAKEAILKADKIINQLKP